MTTENVPVQDAVVVEEVDGHIPAPGADEQKTEIPAAGADDKKPEPEQDSPEEQAKRELSRRARARDRELKARVRAETERDIARAELAKFQGDGKLAEPAEPKREDFTEYEAYLRAVAKFDAKQEAAQILKTEREAQAKQEPPKPSAKAQAWTDAEKEIAKEAKDYHEAVNTFLDEDADALSPLARQAIVDAGPKLLYHLAKNPDVAEKIAELEPRRQVAELVKLEETLAKPEAKTKSSAPKPPTPVGSGKAGIFNPETASPAEYEAARKDGRLGTTPRWAR